MNDMINKNSVRFLVQFVIIIGVSFIVIFTVGYYTAGKEATDEKPVLPEEAVQVE